MTMLAISGALVSSLSNDFGAMRVINNCVMPNSITGHYGWKLTPFGLAVVRSYPSSFAGARFTRPTHHTFRSGANDPMFCGRCGFTVEEHSSKTDIC